MAKLVRSKPYRGPMASSSGVPAAPLGQVDAMPAVQPFNVLQTPQFQPRSASVGFPAIGGNQRQAEVPQTAPVSARPLRLIPEQMFSASQELRPWNMAEAIPQASTAQQVMVGAMQPFTVSDEEMASMLKRADPEIIVNRDRNTGAYTIYSPTSQKSFVINKPGASINDVSNIVATIASALPAGRATTMAGRAAAEAGIQTSIEAGQKGLGGKFNIEEPMLAGAFSAGTDLVSLYNQARRAQKVSQSATQAGVSPQVSQTAAQISRTASTQTPTANVGRAAGGTAPSSAAQTFEQIVNADPRVVQAAESLGLQEVLPMRVFSRNPQYVQVEQALARMPGSVMAEGEKNAILSVAQKADEFITEFGGTRDLGGLNENVINNFNATLNDLRVQSDAIYDDLNSAISPRTRVEPRDARAYLVNRARDFGGVNKLDSLERKILNELRAKPRMTYARLDQLRREVGERYGAALQGNTFGDTTTNSLKNLYNVLTDAQGAVIETIASPTVKSSWDAGKALVQQRKALEETATDLLGEEFSRPIIPQVRGAINGLIDGNINTFEQVLGRIPEQYRSAAVVSAMDNIFTRGARNQTQLNMGGFGSWWEKLSRSETAKNALVKQLPEGAESFLNNLAIISKQYAAATATVPPTGIVKAMGDFGSDNGFLAKILPMIPVAGNRLAGIFSYTGPNTAQAAADLMADPNFRRVVIRGAQGQNAQQAQAAVQRSPAFKAWLDVLPQDLKTRVLSVGLTDYLFEGN